MCPTLPMYRVIATLQENVVSTQTDPATTASASPLELAALRAAVERALDANVHYEDEFKAACRPTWETVHPVVEHRLPDVVQNESSDYRFRREQGRAVKAQVAAGPRGTWAIVRTVRHDGTEWFNTLMHDGAGEVHARSDGWATEPTFAAVVDRMVGMEIYRARKAVEDERARAQAVARVASLGLSVGAILRDVKLSGQKYSSAVVEQITPATGAVGLALTKRGSNRRYRSTALATSLQFARLVLPRKVACP